MAAGTGITAGSRALTARQRNRRLPHVDIPSSAPKDVQSAFESVSEYLRMYEGNSNAPKERFVTIAELEDAGLITSNVKNGLGYISKVLGQNVAQKAGSTSNPTLKDRVKTDTSRQERTPGSGGGSGQYKQRLNSLEDLRVVKPAKKDFLYYDGNKWTEFPLFLTNNIWNGIQNFTSVTNFTAEASFLADINTTHSLIIDNDSNGTLNAARVSISSGDVNLALFAGGTGRTSAIVTGGPTGGAAALRTLGAQPISLATSNTERVRIDDALVTTKVKGLFTGNRIEVQGSSYEVDPTGVVLGQYTSTIGYLQAPLNGRIDIWNSATALIAQFNDDQSTRFKGTVYFDGIDIYGKSNKGMIRDNTDNWIRLNNNNDFTNGVYTPGSMRVDDYLYTYSNGLNPNGLAHYVVPPYSTPANTAGTTSWEKRSAAVTVATWYTIATEGANTDITAAPTGGGGGRAESTFVITDTDSGRHSFVEFKVSINFGKRPTITILNASSYGAAVGMCSRIRVVNYSTYDGSAVQFYAGHTGTAYVWTRSKFATAGYLARTPVAQTPHASWYQQVIDLNNFGGHVGFAVSMSGTGTLADNIAIGHDNTDVFLAFNNSATKLQEGAGNSVRIKTDSGYFDAGPQNTSWCHMQTDREKFYFNKPIHINGVPFRYNQGPIPWHANSSYASGKITVSTSAPSGGSNGAIWFKV